MTQKFVRSFGAILLTSSLLAACSGSPTPNPNPNPTPTPTVAHVELNPASLVLENGKAGQQLKATAFDANGTALSVPVTFTSSKPNVIEVKPDGSVTTKGIGSSQIVATAGGVSSAVGIANSANLSENVVSIPDTKIVSPPVFAAGVTPFSVGSTYTVVLKDVSPTAGKLWFSRSPDGTLVQGKVISSKTVATGTEVTLEIIPISEVFKDIQIEETVPLSTKEITATARAKALFDIREVGNDTFEFTPKSAERLSAQGLSSQAIEDVFRCTGSLPRANFSLGNTTFRLRFGDPRLTASVDLPVFGTKRARLVVEADNSLEVLSGDHTLRVIANGDSTTCLFDSFLEVKALVLGTGFGAKVTPGFTLGGGYASGTRTLSLRGKIANTLKLGVSCNSSTGCFNISSDDPPTFSGGITLSGSSDFSRAGVGLKAAMFVRSQLDAYVLNDQISLINNELGVDLTATLASLQVQVADNVAGEYSMGPYLKVDATSLLASFIRNLLGKSDSVADIRVNGPRVQSPVTTRALLSASNTQVSVTLDANRSKFFNVVSPFALGYNVKEVQLLQKAASGTVSVLTRSTPALDATGVILNVPAGADLNNLYVTVIPKMLDILPVATVKVSR